MTIIIIIIIISLNGKLQFIGIYNTQTLTHTIISKHTCSHTSTQSIVILHGKQTLNQKTHINKQLQFLTGSEILVKTSVKYICRSNFQINKKKYIYYMQLGNNKRLKSIAFALHKYNQYYNNKNKKRRCIFSIQL